MNETALLVGIILLVLKELFTLLHSKKSDNGITRREIEEMKERTKELSIRLHTAEGTLKTIEPAILDWIDERFKKKK